MNRVRLGTRLSYDAFGVEANPNFPRPEKPCCTKAADFGYFKGGCKLAINLAASTTEALTLPRLQVCDNPTPSTRVEDAADARHFTPGASPPAALW